MVKVFGIFVIANIGSIVVIVNTGGTVNINKVACIAKVAYIAGAVKMANNVKIVTVKGSSRSG